MEVRTAGLLSLILFALLPQQVFSQSCCNKREVYGDSADSGNYWLESSSNSACSDGCAYSKEGGAADALYCFSGNKYVLNCSAEIKEAWVTQSAIEPTSLSDKGSFGSFEYCDQDHYAVGFDLQYAPLCERRCTNDDDVGLMAVRLYCAKYNDTSTIVGTITSDVSTGYVRYNGGTRAGIKWTTTQNCATGRFLSSAQYLSEFFIENSGAVTGSACPTGLICATSFTSTNDPIGGMNLNAKCTDDVQLDGAAIDQTEKPDTSLWSDWMNCNPGYAICGLASKIYLTDEDRFHSLGHTGVSFSCCLLPEGYGR